MNCPEGAEKFLYQAAQMESDGADKRRQWAVVLGLPITRDGDQYCILWGENLQEGVAGFGKTPVDAISDFEKAMYESILKDISRGRGK